MHSIYDDSMNGVFVNDTKIDGKITFHIAVVFLNFSDML